jgi:hypothetical protein
LTHWPLIVMESGSHAAEIVHHEAHEEHEALPLSSPAHRGEDEGGGLRVLRDLRGENAFPMLLP